MKIEAPLKMANFLLGQKNPQNEFLAMSSDPTSLMKIKEGFWSLYLAQGGYGVTWSPTHPNHVESYHFSPDVTCAQKKIILIQ